MFFFLCKGERGRSGGWNNSGSDNVEDQQHAMGSPFFRQVD